MSDGKQPLADIFREGGGILNVEAKLDGAGYFIDVLTARTGGVHERKFKFAFIDGYLRGNF